MSKAESLLSSLRSLNPTQRSKFLTSASQAEAKQLLLDLDEAYKNDPWLWLTSEVFTRDEATQQKRRWPDKPHLKELIHVMRQENLVAVPKSRRMMVSWTFAAMAVWEARYWPHHAIFIQSENEDKAAFITDKRCAFIENNLDEPLLRRRYKSIKTAKGAIGRITYPDTESYIWAIPQGASVIRTYTFSRLYMDESDFQSEGHEALTAALSIAETGKESRIVLVTTSDGPQGVVADICRGAGFTKWSDIEKFLQ